MCINQIKQVKITRNEILKEKMNVLLQGKNVPSIF